MVDPCERLRAGRGSRDLPSLIVGSTGIMPGVDESLWMQWADDPMQVDADGRLPLVGLQWAVARAVVVTGEAFIVRRMRRSDCPLALPMQLLVLDGDALWLGLRASSPSRGQTAYGLEYNRKGKRVAYNFRIEDPHGWNEQYLRVPARDVIHVYDPIEPEMERGVPWFTPSHYHARRPGRFQRVGAQEGEHGEQGQHDHVEDRGRRQSVRDAGPGRR